MIKFGSFTVLLLTLLFLLLICNLGFERDCINKMSVIWFPPNHPPVNLNDCYCQCIPLFMKCAIGLLFDTFLPLHGEIVLLLFLYSHWLGPSFSLHLYLTRSCILHTYTHLGTHACSHNCKTTSNTKTNHNCISSTWLKGPHFSHYWLSNVLCSN